MMSLGCAIWEQKETRHALLGETKALGQSQALILGLCIFVVFHLSEGESQRSNNKYITKIRG